MAPGRNFAAIANRAFPIVLDAAIDPPTDGLYLAATGDLVVTLSGPGEQKQTFATHAAGYVPLSVAIVHTGTTATGVLGLRE